MEMSAAYYDHHQQHQQHQQQQQQQLQHQQQQLRQHALSQQRLHGDYRHMPGMYDGRAPYEPSYSPALTSQAPPLHHYAGGGYGPATHSHAHAHPPPPPPATAPHHAYGYAGGYGSPAHVAHHYGAGGPGGGGGVGGGGAYYAPHQTRPLLHQHNDSTYSGRMMGAGGSGGGGLYYSQRSRYAPYPPPLHATPSVSPHLHPSLYTPAGQQLVPSSVLHYLPRQPHPAPHPPMQPHHHQHPHMHHQPQQHPHHPGHYPAQAHAQAQAYERAAAAAMPIAAGACGGVGGNITPLPVATQQPTPHSAANAAHAMPNAAKVTLASAPAAQHFAVASLSSSSSRPTSAHDNRSQESLLMCQQQQSQQQQQHQSNSLLSELAAENALASAEAHSPLGSAASAMAVSCLTTPPLVSASGTDSGISVGSCSVRARSDDSTQSTPVYSGSGGEYPMSAGSSSGVSYHCLDVKEDYDETNADDDDELRDKSETGENRAEGVDMTETELPGGEKKFPDTNDEVEKMSAATAECAHEEHDDMTPACQVTTKEQLPGDACNRHGNKTLSQPSPHRSECDDAEALSNAAGNDVKDATIIEQQRRRRQTANGDVTTTTSASNTNSATTSNTNTNTITSAATTNAASVHSEHDDKVNAIDTIATTLDAACNNSNNNSRNNKKCTTATTNDNTTCTTAVNKSSKITPADDVKHSIANNNNNNNTERAATPVQRTQPITTTTATTTTTPSTTTTTSTPLQTPYAAKSQQHALATTTATTTNNNWSSNPWRPFPVISPNDWLPPYSPKYRTNDAKWPPVPVPPHNSPVDYDPENHLTTVTTTTYHTSKTSPTAATSTTATKTTNKNPIIECDLIPSRGGKRKRKALQQQQEQLESRQHSNEDVSRNNGNSNNNNKGNNKNDSCNNNYDTETEMEVRREIRNITPLPGFQQAFGSTEIGRFSENFLHILEATQIFERHHEEQQKAMDQAYYYAYDEPSVGNCYGHAPMTWSTTYGNYGGGFEGGIGAGSMSPAQYVPHQRDYYQRGPAAAYKYNPYMDTMMMCRRGGGGGANYAHEYDWHRHNAGLGTGAERMSVMPAGGYDSAYHAHKSCGNTNANGIPCNSY